MGSMMISEEPMLMGMMPTLKLILLKKISLLSTIGMRENAKLKTKLLLI